MDPTLLRKELATIDVTRLSTSRTLRVEGFRHSLHKHTRVNQRCDLAFTHPRF
eukprot:COSAG02_NODE_1375_length_13001_cov_3.495272_9_plen_53_part_00